MNINEVNSSVIVEANGCHIWTRAKTAAGYGVARINGKNIYIHRLFWQFQNGEIPKNMVIDHICKNRGCCNVRHLRLVTHIENIMIGDSPPALNSLKTHCNKGHEYSLENTINFTRRNGERVCKICQRNKYLNKKAKKCKL